MKKVLGSLMLVGILATGSMAQYYEPKNVEPASDEIEMECTNDAAFRNLKISIHCSKLRIDWYTKKGRMDVVYNEMNSLGYLYSRAGDYKKAIKYTLQAAEGFKKLGIKAGEADSYKGLGDIYSEKNKGKAIEYYTKASELYKAAGIKEGEADSYNQLGVIYEEIDKGKAIEYYTKAYEIYKSIGNRFYAQDILYKIKELQKKKH